MDKLKIPHIGQPEISQKTSAISKYDHSFRDAHRGYEYLFQWGNGGSVHQCIVGGVGNWRIPKMLDSKVK